MMQGILDPCDPTLFRKVSGKGWGTVGVFRSLIDTGASPYVMERGLTVMTVVGTTVVGVGAGKVVG
jgi:hypothetical protein